MFNNLALQRLTSEADTMLVAPLRFKSVLLEEMDRQIDTGRAGQACLDDPQKQLHQRPADH